MSEQRNIRIGRLHTCTFEQALELNQRTWEGYREEMSRFFPLMAPEPAQPATADPDKKEKKPDVSPLDRYLARFGPNGLRAEHSIVGFVDDKPVGHVLVAMKMMKDKKLAWNGGTGVYPEYRGLGLAKMMMLEMNKVMREQEVDRAYLEVVVKNERAISAYKKGGFRIIDEITGMRCHEPLAISFAEGPLPEGGQLKIGQPQEVSSLDFYREDAAWECMWHNLSGEAWSLIVYDASDQAIAYALFNRSGDETAPDKQSMTLYQCVVKEDNEDAERLFRLMLAEIYGDPQHACKRSTNNLSMSNPKLIALLREAGFATVYEQYLMVLDKPES